MSDPALSGADWWNANQQNYPNSAEIADLAPAFATAVGGFIRALETAGAIVRVSATRRNRQRVYLMHYSWKLAKGQIRARKVPVDRTVPIIWDHGDETASRKAAQEMVELFDIVYEPSLTSNHIFGKAVDMSIAWSEPMNVRNARGREVLIDLPRSDARNPRLHAVGATYGVRKLLTDPPHWSVNGH
ncbi:peptidoglycan-binding domain-containing protein [Sphingomonas segetis]|uniref:peptidoglycan-binding domain-containing protein n=1 Tax=Sphingomonas segetis TaxID=1104779 RepID=UPI0012D2CD3C|nr:peptidoglycan-binding domain-containing protein [Sphingomonas segetis]